jgi:hypothetical protein
LVSGWRLTVRHGPRVRRESFVGIDEALAAMRERAAEIVREGPLQTVQGFRDYEPSDRVAARLELTTGGLIGRRQAGIDVMGDGALVPYAGVLQKRRLEARSPDRAFEAVREALS